MAMRQNGAQIPHGSRWYVERTFLLKLIGDVLLQGDDGGIFPEDIIASWGKRGGAQHGGGGLRDCVGAEVDDSSGWW